MNSKGKNLIVSGFMALSISSGTYPMIEYMKDVADSQTEMGFGLHSFVNQKISVATASTYSTLN